jgi:hypothetical protein
VKTTYNISFSDHTKNTIQLPPYQTDETTSLVLHGYGTYQYGESIWSNLLHLLENFCNGNEPVHAVEGQLWYNSSKKELNLRVKDAAGKLIWKNMTPASGFDASDIANIKDVTSLLTQYLPLKAGSTAKLVGDLYLRDSNDNYSKITMQDGTAVVYPKTTLDDTNKYTAVSRMFVESKIRQEIDKKVEALTPIGGSISQDSVLTALNAIDTDRNPYLRRNGKETFRTMEEALFLRSQFSTTVIGDDEAVSKRYVDARFTASSSVVNDTNILSIINTKLVLNGANKTNLLSKLGDTMLSHLYLPAIEEYTASKIDNDNVAVSKAFVESKLEIGTRPQLSSTIQASYCKTPDGTIMAYGNGRKMVKQTETTALGSTNWFNATITLPVSFSNTFYAVTITEESGTDYPLPRHQYHASNPTADITNKPLWPLTFSVYGKTNSSFKVCVFVPSGMNVDYVEKTLNFNYIAIGR